MAKKTTKKNSGVITKMDMTKFCAFWGIVIAALLFVVSGIFNAFHILTQVVGILDIVGKIALLVAVGFPAYGYVRGKKKAWKIIFWIALVVYAAGVVFSIIKF